MKRVLKSFWNKVSNTGIGPDLDSRLARKVKLTNQIAFVGIVMTFLQLLGFISIPGYALLCLGAISLYATTFVLNKLKKYDLSRLYFCTVSCAVVIVSGSLISEGVNISFKIMIIQAFTIPLVVFDIYERRKILYGFGLFAVSYAVFDTINANTPVMEGIDPAMFDSPQHIMMNGLLCLFTLYLGFRYLQSLNFKAEQVLAETLQVTQDQKEIIENKNKDIQDSINYAQRIQEAILPESDDIMVNLPDHFIFYKPKEKIGGDFYWYGEVGHHIVFAAVDCTGHGTPGALISIIGSKLLDKIVKENGCTDPAEILELMNLEIISTLHSEWNMVKDGMDMSLVSIDTWQRKVTFAGAKNSLLILKEGRAVKIKGDRASIGETHIFDKGFTNHELKLEPEDSVYMYTDGIIDQFGGPDGKKLLNRRFNGVLERNSEYSMKLQADCLKSDLDSWRGDFEQVDDILVIGFRVDFEHINIMRRFRNKGYDRSTWSQAS